MKFFIEGNGGDYYVNNGTPWYQGHPARRGHIKLSDIFEPSELAEGPRESGGWENSGELQKVLATYYRMGCSKTLTAQELGISRSTLWRKLKQIRNPDS